MQSELERAAQAVRKAKFLVFAAGAGMGVDSGLPDFRGNQGFWNAYPPFQKLGLSFVELANPAWFERDPELAWGFYGHRLNLYRATMPHPGFDILRAWGQNKPHGVYTSNVDGHFQKANLENVYEVHGSISHFQCTKPCRQAVWDAPSEPIGVDEATFRASEPLPCCPHCGAMARPNILMFWDRNWVDSRSESQERTLFGWLDKLDMREVMVIEMGAGSAVPTVRYFSQDLQRHGATLVRINPRESQGPLGTISLSLGAFEALRRIDDLLRTWR